MKVKLVPSASSGDPGNHYLTSFLIDEALAIDIGGLGFSGDLEEQRNVLDVFFTHVHFDHIASLPFFLENVFRAGPRPVRLHANAHVLESLGRHVFNNQLWPDFFNLRVDGDPFCECVEIQAETPVRIGDLEVVPIEVNHTVPTFGYVVASPSAAVVIAPDTGPTDRLWSVAGGWPNLKAVFLDVSFPEEFAWLADVSKHLTPSLLSEEVGKLNKAVPVFAIHLKARFRHEIARELSALGRPDLEVAIPGKEYRL